MPFVIPKLLSLSLLVATSVSFVSYSFAAEEYPIRPDGKAKKKLKQQTIAAAGLQGILQKKTLDTGVERPKASFVLAKRIITENQAREQSQGHPVLEPSDSGSLTSPLTVGDDTLKKTDLDAAEPATLSSISEESLKTLEEGSAVSSSSGAFAVQNVPPEAELDRSGEALSSSLVSSTQEVASNARERQEENPPPNPISLLESLDKEAIAYNQARLTAAASFSLPYALTIAAYSSSLDYEFNEFYSLIADRFYQYGKNESGTLTGSYPLATRRQHVITWLSAEIQKMTDQKKALDEGIAARTDGVLGDLQASSQSLGTKIENYNLLTKEALFHLEQTHQFMEYTLNAVQALNRSVTDLEELARSERNADTRAAYEKTIESQKANIGKFKAQILSSEALMHATYPFHRAWTPVLWGAFYVPSSSSNSDRYAVTGVGSLPKSLTISHTMLTDTAGDKEGHYQKYLQAMLVEDAFKLRRAKEQKRIVFQNTSQPANPEGTGPGNQQQDNG